MDAIAVVPIEISGGNTIAQVYNYDYIDFDEIKNTTAIKYKISNSSIFISNFSDWQNWDADVEIGSNISLFISDIDDTSDGKQLKHVSPADVVNVTLKDSANLYRISFYSPTFSDEVFLKLVRETDYTKIFDDERGDFLENIRLNNPDDKTLLALDNANDADEMNSIMNSSYLFNPMILMNPV